MSEDCQRIGKVVGGREGEMSDIDESIRRIEEAGRQSVEAMTVAVNEIERLRQDCAEAYQVLGNLAHIAGLFDTPDVVRALDNIYAASVGEPRPHADLLPWPKDKLS